jgi:glutamate-1-semialdehyde 2,1-aminomutase
VKVPEGRGTFTDLSVEENLRVAAYTRTDKGATRRDLDMVFEYFPILKQRLTQQAGTLSGNPVAVAAGMTTLRLIQQPGFYEKLTAQTAKLAAGLTEAAKDAGVTFCADSLGGMFGIYFSAEVPGSYAEMMESDRTKFNAFFHGMLDEGVYLVPAAFEAGFVSAQHDDAVIEETLAAARRVFARLA